MSKRTPKNKNTNNSRLTLSQDQIDDINSFLDHELASCMDSHENSPNTSNVLLRSESLSQVKREETTENLENKINFLEERMLEYLSTGKKEEKKSRTGIINFQGREKSKKQGRSQKVINSKKRGRSLKKIKKTKKKIMNNSSKISQNSSFALLSAAGRQKNVEIVISDLEKKLKMYKEKLKIQRKKTRELKMENKDLRNNVKKFGVQLKKFMSIEDDFKILLENYEESEKLRLEQQRVIDQMRMEIKRGNEEVKKKKKKKKRNLTKLGS